MHQSISNTRTSYIFVFHRVSYFMNINSIKRFYSHNPQLFIIITFNVSVPFHPSSYSIVYKHFHCECFLSLLYSSLSSYITDSYRTIWEGALTIIHMILHSVHLRLQHFSYPTSSTCFFTIPTTCSMKFLKSVCFILSFFLYPPTRFLKPIPQMPPSISHDSQYTNTLTLNHFLVSSDAQFYESVLCLRQHLSLYSYQKCAKNVLNQRLKS